MTNAIEFESANHATNNFHGLNGDGNKVNKSYMYNATSIGTDIVYFVIIFLISTIFYGVNVSKPLLILLNNDDQHFLYLLIFTMVWVVCNMS